jgi:hypothetical protein
VFPDSFCNHGIGREPGEIASRASMTPFQDVLSIPFALLHLSGRFPVHSSVRAGQFNVTCEYVSFVISLSHCGESAARQEKNDAEFQR